MTLFLPTWMASLFLPESALEDHLAREFLHCTPHQAIFRMRSSEAQGHAVNGVDEASGESDA